MENLIPRWYRELELFRGVKPLLVLEGCVMDQVRVPVTGSVAEDTLLPLPQAGVPVPEWLDQAILKAMAVRAEDRYQTAEEFLRAIEGRPLNGPTCPPGKTGLRERIQTERERRKAVAE